MGAMNMDSPKNKWIEAATKLIQFTNEGKIKWSADQGDVLD